jgi:hypothetical protein
VNFSAVAYDGGAPVIEYVATALPGNVQAQCMVPCTSITVQPLAPGSYTFVINAVNAAGIGPTSPPSNRVKVYPADDIFHDGFDGT